MSPLLIPFGPPCPFSKASNINCRGLIPIHHTERLVVVKSKLVKSELDKFRLDNTGIFMVIDKPVKNKKGQSARQWSSSVERRN